ncbi:hypothetical protein, partial [Enterobacter hormaechei]|uniref:hypothetical protein n=1 Tax=Enterobacter hormaechei TaxID=158836 RepID=UPI001953C107
HFFSLNGDDPTATSMVTAQLFFPGSILSLHGHHLAAAREAGLLREEIVAIDTPAGRVAEDGCIRPGTNLES